MRRSGDCWEETIDEYLWPLTGEAPPINWSELTEEMQIRQRLGEIMAHVRMLHVEPRLRRLGPRVSFERAAAALQAIVEGPSDGPAWAQTLKEPVPRALREEWTALGRRLRDIERRREVISARPVG